MKSLINYQPAEGSNLLLPPATNGFTINLSEPHSLSRPTCRNPKRKVIVYPSQCLKCHRWYLLRKDDAISASQCRSCHCRAIGCKGYAVTVQRWGRDFALKHVQAYQLNHPSTAEQLVMGWLDDLAIPYERQCIWSAMTEQGEQFHFILDFVIGDLAIEVNGPFHDPQHPLANERRITRDQMLAAVWDGTLVVLDTARLVTVPSSIRTIRTSLIEKIDEYLIER